MSEPIPEHLVTEGESYWASWGNKGWSAVTVLEVRRTRATVERVNPLTNERLLTNATVRLDELVKRNSALCGKDKPLHKPLAVFAAVRQMRLTK